MKRLVLTMLCLLLCTGCTALPAEERAFAVALGVDRAEGEWRVYARIPTYRTDGGYDTLAGQGRTLPAALADMDATAPMHLHLGQLRLLIFTQRLTETEGFGAALDSLAARHDLRLQAQLAVTEAELQQFMDALQPASGTRLSKAIDVLTETRREQGMLLPSTLSEVIRMGERQSPVLPVMSLAGDAVSITGGWAVSRSGRTGEKLSLAEMQLLCLMNGSSFSGTLMLSSGDAALSSAMARVTLQPGGKCDVVLTLRCPSASLSGDALADAVARECLSVLNRLARAGCDALGVARQAVMNAPTMEAFHALNWPERFAQLEWTVHAGVEGPA